MYGRSIISVEKGTTNGTEKRAFKLWYYGEKYFEATRVLVRTLPRHILRRVSDRCQTSLESQSRYQLLKGLEQIFDAIKTTRNTT